MSGVRVSGISNGTDVTETDLKIYFSKPSNGGGNVSKIYYPLLNNDAVVIFKEPRVVDTVVTVSHEIRDMDLSVQALPLGVFVKIEATLNTEISALISATERYQDYLKYSADLELKFDEDNDGWILCGNWFQVEWAWNFINSVLERQLSIHTNLVGHSNSQVNRHADVDSKSVPKVRKKKMSPTDLRRSTSAKSEQQSHKQFPNESLSKGNETGPNTPSGCNRERTEIAKKRESDITSTAGSSVLDAKYPNLRTEVLKRGERSETGSSPSSDSETGGIHFGLDRPKSGIRHKKPRTERNACPRQLDADGTFEEFSRMKVTENIVERKVTEKPKYEKKEHETELKSLYSSDEEHELFDSEHNRSPKTTLKRSAKQYSLKRRSNSPVDFQKTNIELKNIPDVGTERTIRESSQPSERILERSSEYFNFVVGDIEVYIFCGDITTERTDAIVNAAMGTFINGAGVARAIARLASPSMQEECDRFVKQNGPLKTSEVLCTTAGGSLSKDVSCILHTVGPIWFDEERERCFYELTRTFLNCFKYANKNWLKSISLPTISSGIFQVPLEVCMLSFFEALLLFTSEPPTKTYLTEIHLVNNDPSVVVQCVDYLKIILHKDLDVSLAKALERFNDFESDKQRLSTKHAPGRAVNSKTYLVSGDEKINYTHARNGGRKSEKRPTERRATSLSRAVRKKSFSESEWDSVSTSNKKSGGQGSDAASKSQSSTRPNFVRSQSFDTNRSGSVNKQKPQSADTSSPEDSHKSRTVPGDHHRAIAPSSYKFDPRIKSSPPRMKPSLNTKSKTLKEKPRRFEDRETKFSHQPLKADISLGDATKGVTSCDDSFMTVLNRHDCEFEYDGFQSLPASIRSVDSKQKMFGRIDKTPDVPDIAELEKCPICLDTMLNPKILTKCHHKFCKECIEEHFSRGKPVCPSCGMVYGILRGDQPKGGKMTSVVQRNIQIPGFEDSVGAIVITYNIPSGLQEDHHPNPGHYYSGITRKAFLPYNEEGREIVRLLEKAFNAGLMFTIGQSRTTGSDGVVTWNDIHHKTSVDGGSDNFGYPDKTYLKRVREELAAKGITAP